MHQGLNKYPRTFRASCLLTIILLFLCSCIKEPDSDKVVICIPVYGQSLALGEEAERITDFDSLSSYANGRIVTKDLDHDFGYFDINSIKESAKKLIRYRKRSYELSIYSMARTIAHHTGKDTMICIFPGGQGATAIAQLSKGSAPYSKFIKDIETACQEAHSRGWSFIVPAICWMQGESDIVDYPPTNYQQQIKKIWKDMNADILSVTQQKDSIPFIIYQPNSLSRANHFNGNNYTCREAQVPQTFVNLLISDTWFWASGPTYPYSCVHEKIHIDAKGQQHIGMLAATSAIGILHKEKRNMGLIPTSVSLEEDYVSVHYNIPEPPLTFDTIQVSKANHYGFSVINKENRDILQSVSIEDDVIRLQCSESPQDCFVRYAVNGDYMKSGCLHGPRGNLRDQGNWCYQFNIRCE